MNTEAEPLITPPPALGPPIIGTDPSSAPGIVQPQYKSGSATAPATPIPITGTPIIPTSTPPGGVGQIGDPIGFPVFPPTGSNTAPVPVPIGPEVGPAIAAAAVPPSIAGVVQPQYKSGSGTVPTAASLFPAFTSGSPSPPIVFANIAQIGTVPPPLPSTPPATNLIVISTAPAIPQLPWNPGPAGLPVNTVRPTITGTTTVGSTLTASTGTWSNSPTAYAYEWLRDGNPIAGANNSTFILVAGDASAMIAVIVTATNANGEASAESAEVGPIAPAAGDDPEARLDDNGAPNPAPRAAPKHTTTKKKR